MLVYLKNGTAAMLVYINPTNPPGIEPYDHATIFFWNKVTDHLSENTLIYTCKCPSE